MRESADEDRATLGSDLSAPADHWTDEREQVVDSTCSLLIQVPSPPIRSVPQCGKSRVWAEPSERVAFSLPVEYGMARRRGRPHEGPELVEKLDDCSQEARQRLKVIFQTIAGVFTVDQACEILGIRRSAFNKLRSQFITSAVHLLEPRTPGRKKKIQTPEQQENQRLREENERLQFELKAQQLREEIGILMPHLLKRSAEIKKKIPKKRTARRTPGV